MSKNKEVPETTNTEEVKTVNNIQKIFHKFNDSLDDVHLYFRKFLTDTLDEDMTRLQGYEKLSGDLLSDLEKERLKKKKVESNGSIVDIDESKVKLEGFEKKSLQTEIENEIVTEGEVEIGQEVVEEKENPISNELARRFALFESMRPRISLKNFEIFSRGTFLILNNYFEYLLVDLLTYYYTKYKNSLDAKEFKVSLQELNEYESIEEITKHLILKEVENIIVEKTFDQLLEHFEKTLHISLEKEIIDWGKIIEIRERRHLIVHNSSIVNKKYISRTKNPYNYNVGDVVNIDHEYFHFSYKQFRVAGQVLLFNCWGNWDKDDADTAIGQMMTSSFESLCNEDFESALKICKYCDQIIAKNEDQENSLLRIKINKAIAYKKLNNKTELAKVLKMIKVGTSSPIFKIAFQILNDDHKGLVENFKNAILLEELDIDCYLKWPIFDFVRNDEKLNKLLLAKFKI